MYKEIMRSIEGVEIFPVIGLLLFIAFFVWMVIRVWRSDKSWLDDMASMPTEGAGMRNLHLNEEAASRTSRSSNS